MIRGFIRFGTSNRPFYIQSTDTRWLRISSSADNNNLPFGITVHGSLKVDSVKIISWNSTTNNYSTTSGTPEHPGSRRPFIRVKQGATCTTNITYSEIAYRGYGGKALGLPNRNASLARISYIGDGGKGRKLNDNNIHDTWFGFYSSGLQFIYLAEVECKAGKTTVGTPVSTRVGPPAT
jgi:mannuronan 5-epimerase